MRTEIEITKEEFEKKDAFECVCKTRWHPCGYDMWGEKFIERDGKYYFSWNHSHCCD